MHTTHKIQIYSDHKNLQYWKSPQHINCHIAREVLELSEYNYKIHHVKGKENAHADALSRQLDYHQGEDDNQAVMVLPEHVFVRTLTLQAAPDAMTEISTRDMKVANPVYQQNPQTLKPWVSTHDLQLIKGTWYKDPRWVVTGGMHDKRTIIESHHNPQVYGHPGIKRMTHLVERGYCGDSLLSEPGEHEELV